MNPDIVYEILKWCHIAPEENSGALLAKKIVISSKIEERKMDKPIVFDVCAYSILITSTLHIGDLVYWGDGKVLKIRGKNYPVIHEYSSFGKYTVRIFSNIYRIPMPTFTTEVHSIGNLTSLSLLFENVPNFVGESDKWDTSRVTDMSGLFYGCRKIDRMIGTNWNTASVKNMSCMFADCCSLNKNVGKHWDTSKVTGMMGMFSNCTLLNQPIGLNWDTSQAIYLAYMFSGCESLRQPVAKGWKFDNVIEAQYMFLNCKNYKKTWIEETDIDRVPYKVNFSLCCKDE
jgi:hypothetical protein